MEKRVSFDLHARTGLVTGGSSGIGKALAQALSRAGMDVVIADIDSAALQKVVKEPDQDGGRILGLTADISDPDQVAQLTQEAHEKLDSIDVLINAAGIYPRATVLEIKESQWDQVLSVNLRSIFLLARAVLPKMIEKGFGRVISLTSDLGTSGIPEGAHYAVSKAGLNVLTRSLAREVREENVTINAIAPGPTDTPMLRGSNSPEYIQAVAAQTARGSLGTPEDVVSIVLFLTSQAGARITGQVLPLNN